MEDRISTLPNNIIELILMCLPLVEAVRTSILSSRWRYQWCTIPQLVFDEQSVSSKQHELDDIVNQVLLLHNGPIHKFLLDTYSDLKDAATVDRWMVFLSRNNVKELSLSFSGRENYKLPSALYSCPAIVSLKLHACDFGIFRSFNGFNCLTNLFLEHICISDTDFESLISKCPILRKLIFIDFFGCRHLKLNAPRLQELAIGGVFSDIHLENSPDLATLHLELEDDEDIDNDDEEFENEDVEIKEECIFTQCLGNFLNIEKLRLLKNSIDFLTRGHGFVQFSTYSCLKKVILGYFNFKDLKHVIALQSLLQNAPMLKNLKIEADSDEAIAIIPTSSFFDKSESRNFSLDQLHSVRLTELIGVPSEVEFIEFILLASSVLKSLTIGLCSEAQNDVKFYKEILRFRRASAQAEIVILD